MACLMPARCIHTAVEQLISGHHPEIRPVFSPLRHVHCLAVIQWGLGHERVRYTGMLVVYRANNPTPPTNHMLCHHSSLQCSHDVEVVHLITLLGWNLISLLP
ncbi:uncharacterized protein YALI1_E20604g [Yarrowia lipolytica]|uniref:Uncharacterized protein n=1 Tax=Yarrowia lipolytica TaxID=4952 RepID=A0A1D8NIT2_YARLL|nr:hypothetical protein YALI1_E20604g [Yarrowia lipolytica]